ncbi:N-acetyltransferase HPA3 [Wickerhamomyces ciferrii]|uniref:N-acetyltransferase HPA3 n=1 Tax=Wickerhamomyces ciferrii (strain ATCC 14091 / BCRC 22168 / CBS 111 / JCM 3599 / NBRC 0793 / NRRL Y-1031 F-60-10) TaxID=1206466 RepID=K0KEW2_WICCF|nr:N-acetyltransferase HPA3 [Wickerhamomyces ciferrii]CCH41486.1 N-acetyltransferase HPA3 [Wickerhamomyces ciferrii]
MSFAIHPVTKEDEEEWTRLFKLYLVFYKATVSDEIIKSTFQRALDPEIKLWAALAFSNETQKPIGLVNYFSHIQTWDIKDKILLNDLYVDEDARVKGVGRGLIEYVYNHADELGTPEVYWNTDKTNHRAQLLYTKVGVEKGKNSYKRPL